MKKVISLILALCLTVALAACSTSGNTEGPNKDPGKTTNTPTEDGQRELKIGVTSAPQNISPFTHFTNRNPVDPYLYEKLMVKNPNGEFVGVLAKKWSTEDNLTYDITIYDYIKDSAGNAITADDVVYCFEQSRGDMANIWLDTIEKTGDYSVRITVTDTNVRTFPDVIDRAPIVSKASYEAAEDGMTTSCVSTSPYIVTDFVPNVSITLEKNPNYWQTDASCPALLYNASTVDKMEFIKVSEPAQQSIALETGSIDIFNEIATTEVATFLEGGRNANGYTVLGYASTMGYCLYYSGVESIVSDDLNLRLAIAHAIDTDAISLGAFDGHAKACSFYGLPDGMIDLTPTNTDNYFPYDIELAKNYLANSNYNGETIRLLVINEDLSNRIASIIQGELNAIGIECTIDSFDNAIYQNHLWDGTTFDIAMCSMGMTEAAFIWDYVSWTYTDGMFGLSFKDEKFDALLDEFNKVEGYTVENATKVSDYMNEHCYALGLVAPMTYTMAREDLGVTEMPLVTQSRRYISALTFEK